MFSRCHGGANTNYLRKGLEVEKLKARSECKFHRQSYIYISIHTKRPRYALPILKSLAMLQNHL
jgi:hypothetical protein